MSLFLPADHARVYDLIVTRYSVAPRPLAEIQLMTGFSARRIKQIVEELRADYRLLVGARRGKPSGYFWIMTVADVDETVAPMVSQAKRMLQAASRLAGKRRVREMLGQGVLG